jgi:MFS transporter, PAT family, beta-lactamase induction signal transducer AmpG
MKSWLAALEVYRDRRMLAILAMGFGSGLPLALTGYTLSVWLADVSVSLKTIGFFSLVGIAYTFKFVWSPLLDQPLPPLTRWLGRRRGWGLVIQLALAGAILALGATDPVGAPAATAALACLVAFLSASQDIVIDAFRVELLRDEEQGAGASATQVGYRVAMIASTAGALYLATYLGWFWTYAIMAGAMAVGIAALLLTAEPVVPLRPAAPGQPWLVHAVVDPLVDFFRRQGARPGGGLAAVLWSCRQGLAILVFVMLYKLGDAMAGHMSGPFYLALGFSKIEIANITKIFGVLASIAGIAAGGAAVYRLGIMRGLLVCGVLQMVANLFYIVQAQAGHDPVMLIATIGAENFLGGMGSAAFVAYLSSLCNKAFTATQYALLSALATVGRTMVSSTGGWIIELIGWVDFFLVSTALALPGLALLLWLMRRDVAPAGGAAAPAE